MPLVSLNLRDTKVTDLRPLKGIPLKKLNIANTAVNDISSVEMSHMEHLYVSKDKLTSWQGLENLKNKDVIKAEEAPGILQLLPVPF